MGKLGLALWLVTLVVFTVAVGPVVAALTVAVVWVAPKPSVLEGRGGNIAAVITVLALAVAVLYSAQSWSLYLLSLLVGWVGSVLIAVSSLDAATAYATGAIGLLGYLREAAKH